MHPTPFKNFNPNSGILLVRKPAGPSSASFARKIGRLLDIQKVGHAGTLDPFAEGILLVLLGEGTKLSSYLMSYEKAYEAMFLLGRKTDTYDSEGKILEEKGVSKDLSLEKIQSVLEQFKGTFRQIPPVFSAKKKNGVSSYRLARKGKVVALEAQEVNISQLQVLSWKCPFLKIALRSSKGMYVRSLANDVGEILGCGAYLHQLKRISHGPFQFEQAISCQTLEEAKERQELPKILQTHLLSLHQSLPLFPFVQLMPKSLADYVRQGRNPNISWLREKFQDARFSKASIIKIIDSNEHLIALLERKITSETSGKPHFSYLRVFNKVALQSSDLHARRAKNWDRPLKNYRDIY